MPEVGGICTVTFEVVSSLAKPLLLATFSAAFLAVSWGSRPFSVGYLRNSSQAAAMAAASAVIRDCRSCRYSIPPSTLMATIPTTAVSVRATTTATMPLRLCRPLGEYLIWVPPRCQFVIGMDEVLLSVTEGNGPHSGTHW